MSEIRIQQGGRGARLRTQGALFADIDVDVSFHDIDMGGVVWHGHYLRYLENARWALMNRLGYSLAHMVESGFVWPIVALQTKYVSSARFGDRLSVRASLVEWEARLTVNYLLSRPADGARIMRARTVQVAVDARSGKLQFALPANFVAIVQAALAGTHP
jgi:acyl-CoA thioester hydrolase